jgi:hypothetical protein
MRRRVVVVIQNQGFRLLAFVLRYRECFACSSAVKTLSTMGTLFVSCSWGYPSSIICFFMGWLQELNKCGRNNESRYFHCRCF